MTRRFAIFTVLGSALLALAACAPDGGSSDPQATAGGGIGGTGKGKVTSYGSIIFGQAPDTREFEVAPGPTVTLDGADYSEAELQNGGTGWVATYVLADDADPQLTHGTALSVEVEHQIVGEVTSDSPFEVLQQRVVRHSQTWEVTPDDIALGEDVAVSGYANPQNRIYATRLEELTAPAEWKLVGGVTDLVPGYLWIGEQAVNLSAATITACEGQLSVGALVDVRAKPFLDRFGDLLAESMRCIPAGLQLPPGSPVVSPAALEGIVTDVVVQVDRDPDALPRFSVNGQTVWTTENTKFFKGEPEDIVVGALVEVQGTLDGQTGILTADKVRFQQTRVRVTAPLYTDNVVPGESLTILSLTIEGDDLTHDPKHILGEGLNQDTQATVHAYEATVGGPLIATRIVSQGNPDPSKVHLRGPVGTIFLGLQQFEILGVRVDTSDPATTYYNVEGKVISKPEFFSLLSLFPEVRVNSATYDEGTDTLSSAVEIRLEE